MKRYFIKYYADFANTYHLVYTTDKEQAAQAIAEGYEQITRARAEALCRAEMERRKYASGYYAPVTIVPFDIFDLNDRYKENPRDYNRFRRVGYILERV